ncbi:guanylate kinase [Cichlidogyrus casuarinus]|uniref:guanylate kinase n=1 Tax=Cichlidogyrus casuarinus TaxID=1844966 RepID=A0ABD2QNI5_9PLAT
MRKLRPLVISGPSGAGKSTLLNLLFKKYESCFAFSVSHTTRGPRPGEEDGKHYYFTNREEFNGLIEKDEFLEHAEFAGNLYGTSKRSVDSITSSGKICVLDVDLAGVKSIYNSQLDAKFVFVRPPSLENLKQRLIDRKTETEETISKRLARALADMEFADSAAGKNIYDLIVINDKLEDALQQLETYLADDINQVRN